MKQKLLKFLDNFEMYLMFILMIAFLVNIFLQVFCRAVFNHPLGFTEEVSRYSFLWMVMLGFSYTTKNDKHIRVTIFTQKISPKANLWIETFINVLATLLFAWVLYMGIQYVGYTAQTKTPSLQISRAYIAVIVPITAALMIIRSIQKIGNDHKKYKEEKS